MVKNRWMIGVFKYCQARVPSLTYWMVKHLGEKLKSHRESQKWTRADAIIQIHPPTTTTFQNNCKSQCLKILIAMTLQSVNMLQYFKTLQSIKTLHRTPFLFCYVLFHTFRNSILSQSFTGVQYRHNLVVLLSCEAFIPFFIIRIGIIPLEV